jgi:hypothetical protein
MTRSGISSEKSILHKLVEIKARAHFSIKKNLTPKLTDLCERKKCANYIACDLK